MSVRIRLVLSCGAEPTFEPIIFDTGGIKHGEIGWCCEHPEATVDAVFVVDEADPVLASAGKEGA